MIAEYIFWSYQRSEVCTICVTRQLLKQHNVCCADNDIGLRINCHHWKMGKIFGIDYWDFALVFVSYGESYWSSYVLGCVNDGCKMNGWWDLGVMSGFREKLGL